MRTYATTNTAAPIYSGQLATAGLWSLVGECFRSKNSILAMGRQYRQNNKNILWQIVIYLLYI